MATRNKFMNAAERFTYVCGEAEKMVAEASRLFDTGAPPVHAPTVLRFVTGALLLLPPTHPAGAILLEAATCLLRLVGTRDRSLAMGFKVALDLALAEFVEPLSGRQMPPMTIRNVQHVIAIVPELAAT